MTEKNGHTLLFDGDCPFCRLMVNRWRGTLERRGFELVPLQTEWVRRRLDLPEAELLSEMRVLTPDGRVLGGAAALVHVWGGIWWAWPLWLLALVPGVKWLLDRAYRWVAERRMCLSGVCTLHAHPEPKRGLEVLGWLPLVTLPVLVVIFQNEFPEKWIFMWALAVAIFISCKWLTWVRTLAAGGMGGIGRALGYLFLWPGMDAKPFMGEGEMATKPVLREWLAAGFKVLLGVGLMWGLVPVAGEARPIAAGWCGMIALMFLLHFGAFHLLSLAWRSYGVAAEPIMRVPAAATSLSTFWGERWNRGFNELAHELIFRKTCRRLGVAWAMLLVFLASGLLHDLVISVPAGAWFGLPTAYFVLQGIGVLIERSRWGRRVGLGHGALGWGFMFVFTAGPAYWAFHPPFVEQVMVPFFKVIGAL